MGTMRARCGALSVLAAMTPVAISAQADRGWTAEQQEIVALAMQAAEANNAGDVDGWVALFADGAVYMPPGVPPERRRSRAAPSWSGGQARFDSTGRACRNRNAWRD